jgi:hypothetical protein
MKLRSLALVALVLVAVVSVYFLARAAALPRDTLSTSEAIQGTGTSIFTYNASLRPNLLFNATYAGPDQGELFPQLVLGINLSYQFTLNLSAPASTVVYATDALVVSTPAWNYTLIPSAERTRSFPSTPLVQDSQSLDMNLTASLQRVGMINNQTGYLPPAMVFRYATQLVYEVNGSGQDSVHTFSPSFNLTYTNAVILHGNRSFSSQWYVNVTAPVPDTSVGPYLAASASLTAGSLLGVGILAYLEVRPLPPRPRTREDEEARLKAEIGAYRDAVAETLTLPHKENIVVVRDWMDVVRAADMLGKPILHLRNDSEGQVRHLFYVVDGAIQYVYLRSVEAPPEPPISEGRGTARKPPGRGPRLWDRIRGEVPRAADQSARK